MTDHLYRFSAATVALARRLQAGFFFGIVLVIVMIALWLALAFGLNWFVLGFDIFLGLCAAELFVKACTVYASAQQPERPDDRERYLRSRALYVPNSKRDDRHNERRSQS